MALISCPRCGKPISDRAKTCPKCGCPVGYNANVEPQSQSFGNNGPQEVPKKKKSKAWLWIILGLLVAALAVMATTNPSKNDHIKEIQKELSKAFGQAISELGGDTGLVMGMMGDKLAPMLEKQLDYHNYVFFSTVTDKNGERLSWGLFGNVWANIDQNEVKKLQESMDSLMNLGGALGSGLDDTNANSDNAATTDDESVMATTLNDDDIPDLNLDDLGREVEKAAEDAVEAALAAEDAVKDVANAAKDAAKDAANAAVEKGKKGKDVANAAKDAVKTISDSPGVEKRILEYP